MIAKAQELRSVQLDDGFSGLRVAVQSGSGDDGYERFVEIVFAAPKRFRYLDEPDQLAETIMTHDTEKIDNAVLALLQLGLHDESRAWKTLDWEAMSRLYEKGLISDPVGKAKSVELTERGMVESRRLFAVLFGS